MSSEPEPDISRMFREGTPIDEAMARAVRDAILQHKQKGQPLTVWRDGKTVLIPPESVSLETDPKQQPSR